MFYQQFFKRKSCHGTSWQDYASIIQLTVSLNALKRRKIHVSFHAGTRAVTVNRCSIHALRTSRRISAAARIVIASAGGTTAISASVTSAAAGATTAISAVTAGTAAAVLGALKQKVDQKQFVHVFFIHVVLLHNMPASPKSFPLAFGPFSLGTPFMFYKL